ncbi:MAG: amidohydrolase family protein [Candidatus Aminicenantes bacterium]|nr:amidohydrolase family protein [Candidatus Aminicenantes bacterium]
MTTKLRFFDCNCTAGRTGYPLLFDIFDAAGLQQEMATAGIEEALVYHAVARDADPPLGNSLLMEEIKGRPGLYPVWVVLPHHTGEMPPPDQLLGEMKAQGVQAVRMYPGRDHHSFSLADWCAGELLAALEAARLPLVLDTEIVIWEEVFSLLKSYPHLPLIMANCSYRHNRFLYPLWEKFQNLFVETSRFMGGGAIEDVIRHFGARPLLFGTNMPYYTGTAAVALVTYADLAAQDQEAIAGGNLRRLIREMWP